MRDGVLYLKPTLTTDFLGDPTLMGGASIDLWGSNPADQCTGNAFYGCQRVAGGGGNVINPIQSARLRTAQSFSFKYGRVEIRAQLPKGDWIWPALWMLPRYNPYGGWPASGEIDIMESRGNSPSYPEGGYDSAGSTLHWGPDWSRNFWTKTHKVVKGLSDDFHVFGLVWTDKGLYTYVDSDSNRVLEVDFSTGQSMWDRTGLAGSTLTNPWEGRGNSAPFDQKFFLVMNVAVGGTATYFPDGEGGKMWTNTDQHAVNAFWNAKNNWSTNQREGSNGQDGMHTEDENTTARCGSLVCLVCLSTCVVVRRYSTWHGDDVAMKIDYVRVYGV